MKNVHDLAQLLLQVPQLQRADLRVGCVARAQMVASVFHHAGYRVGRAWVLPLHENHSFFAPIAYGARPLKWRYHCAAWLPDEPEQPVLDIPLAAFISFAAWQEQFVLAQQKQLRQPPPELRFVGLDFAAIPQRQLLRYHPQAQRHRELLSPLQIARRLLCTTIPVSPPTAAP